MSQLGTGGHTGQSVVDSVQCHWRIVTRESQPAAGLSASAQSPEGPRVTTVVLSSVSPSLSTRQDYSLLSSSHRYCLLCVARASDSDPHPSSVSSSPRLCFLQHSDSILLCRLRTPFRNLGNNDNAEEKGRESLCRKSVLNSQLHRVQQQ